MQTLIEGLLTLSRVTTKGQQFVPVNLAEITQEVLSDLEISIQQTEGTIEVGKLPTILADPLQMRQLIQNLISNALKFHRQNQPPIIKIYSHFLNNDLDNTPVSNVHYQIIVEDNGIGFAEKYLDRIFNIFQRLHSRHEYEGTGIGLAICRKIVERHHGHITAKSQPDQGAKFIITLPINSQL
jgi:signal transduction histidine kinase